MADLRSNYLRLGLRNPVTASAGPLSWSVGDIKALMDARLNTVAMFSLFEEQLPRNAGHLVGLERQSADITPKAISFFPEMPRAKADAVTNYLWLIGKGIQAINVSLIASLNGASRGEQVHSARSLQNTGMAALGLNIYYVPDGLTLGSEEVGQRYLNILRAVKSKVSIPVAVELDPYFSSVGVMYQRLDRAGVDGLVLFNRFLQSNIDLDWLGVVSGVMLSSPMDTHLPRTRIAVLRDRVGALLTASSGVDQPGNIVGHLLAEADVVCIVLALVCHNVEHTTRLIEGLESWLDGERPTLDRARNMSAVSGCTPTDVYEHAGYVAALKRVKATYGSLP